MRRYFGFMHMITPAAMLALIAAAPLPSGPKVVGDVATWITADDYPAEAIRNDEEGIVTFRLSIDAIGAVTDCAVLSSSGSATLDTATCTLARKRARFRPARAPDGRPIPSDYTRHIVWRLPEVAPTPLTAFSTVATLDIAKANVVISCKVDRLGSDPAEIAGDPCASDRPSRRFWRG
jgi:protein TonB